MLNNNLKLRLITLFVQNTSTIAVLPFMALLLTENSGAKVAGVVLFCGTIIKFISTIIGGYWIDIVRSKNKFVCYISFLNGCLFLIMGILTMYLNYQTTIPIFICIYLITEITMAIARPAYNTITLYFINSNNRMIYSKWKYWISNSSLALGMMLGGLLYENFKFILFFSVFIALTINAIIFLYLIKDVKTEDIDKKNDSYISRILNSYKVSIKNTMYVKCLIAGVLILSAEFAMPSYVSVRLANSFEESLIFNLKLSGVKIYSILMIINTTMVVFFSFMILKIITNINLVRRVFLSGFLYAFGYFFVISSNNLILLLISMVVATIGEIIFSPLYESEKIKMIPKDKRGIYSALDGLSSTLSQLLARCYLILSGFLSPLHIAITILLLVILGFFILSNVTSKNQALH